MVRALQERFSRQVERSLDKERARLTDASHTDYSNRETLENHGQRDKEGVP